MTAPQRERGWSKLDPIRKAEHDFSNTLTELLYAIEMRDQQLVTFYVDLLKQEYSHALRPRV